jgi:hypothetical protein
VKINILDVIAVVIIVCFSCVVLWALYDVAGERVWALAASLLGAAAVTWAVIRLAGR